MAFFASWSWRQGGRSQAAGFPHFRIQVRKHEVSIAKAMVYLYPNRRYFAQSLFVIAISNIEVLHTL